MELSHIVISVLHVAKATLILQNHFGFNPKSPDSNILIREGPTKIELTEGRQGNSLVFKFESRGAAAEKVKSLEGVIKDPKPFPDDTKTRKQGQFYFVLDCGLHLRFTWGS